MFDWGLDRELVASTYSDRQFISRLYFENQYLLRQRKKFTVGEGYEAPAEAEVSDQERYAFVRQFMRETTEDPVTLEAERHLIIANEYTSKQNQYANGFVHRRIKLYQERGLNVDVIAFGKRLKKDVYIYDGVNVLSGYYDELLGLLASRNYASISVHFINADMWKALKRNIANDTVVLVYSHGYEVRNWTRMPYQIHDRKSFDGHIERNLQTRDVWHEMYEPGSGIDKFIFVSEWWRRAVSEDVMLPFDDRRSGVIHNVIDNAMFPYVEKDPEQRFRILWIRNASKWNYGADIAAKILARLKKSSYWNKITATIVGDGEFFSYFDQFSNDDNVTIHRGYLGHKEIAELHKEHGLFLVPSRWDTQGVSRDEAMSSGLVPITNPVDAIPEFVDPTVAILGEENDFDAWFEKIEEVLEDPDRFLTMSAAAAEHVRKLSNPDSTVGKEVALMRGVQS